MVCLCSLRSLKVPALQHSRRIRTDPTIQYMWVSGLLAKLRSKKVRKYSDFRQIQHEIRKFWLLCGDSVSTCYSNFWVPTPTTCSCIFYHVHAFSILSSDIATAPAFTDLRFAALAFEFPNNSYNRCIDSELWLRNNHHPVLATLAKPHAWLVPEHIILVQMCGNILGTFCVWPT